MSEITLAEQIACVERELGFRRRCYPNWIEQKKVKREVAEVELARMEAVLRTLLALQRIETDVALDFEGHA